MLYISHRVNTIEQLKGLPEKYGVEIDLRDKGDRIELQHDPFTSGQDFEEYLKLYNHGTMILNIKSERIEHRALELLNKYNIKDYFFLDLSFPMIHLLSQQGEKRIALRVSEFEKLDTIREMAGRVDWIWVDCFTRIPITVEELNYLKEMGYKTCLVSPELQGRPDDVDSYINKIKSEGFKFDAICSKQHIIHKWENCL